MGPPLQDEPQQVPPRVPTIVPHRSCQHHWWLCQYSGKAMATAGKARAALFLGSAPVCTNKASLPAAQRPPRSSNRATSYTRAHNPTPRSVTEGFLCFQVQQAKCPTFFGGSSTSAGAVHMEPPGPALGPSGHPPRPCLRSPHLGQAVCYAPHTSPGVQLVMK